MNEDLALKRAQMWAKNPAFDEESRNEINSLIQKKDIKEITDRFYKDLEFGTGGMRSILGQGNNRINKYTIRKASQAVANVIKSINSNEPKIAIAYDSRRYSFDFAKEAAGVFAANNISAYIYKKLNPVALVSFAIRHLKADAGIMVTASHNPPDYNGYKVFWSDGAQITPPHDHHIISEFNSITDFSTIRHLPFQEGLKEGLIHWIDDSVEDQYYINIKTKSINQLLCQEKGSQLKIVYTPIHGTGLIPCTRALKNLGLTNILVVEEQAAPDENFPTVKSPNPENPQALALAVKLLKDTNADIALGTDPDTDRVGIALEIDSTIHYLNGNQIGILMLHYLLSNLSETNQMPSNPYFIKTIVTTDLQKKIADHFGVETENTLTGFKWICRRLGEIEKNQPERNFIFATEESFGYLNHDYVRDKDGVSSIALISEIALWYKLKGLNLIQALDKIYDQFGFYHETLLCLNYYGKEGAEKIIKIMDYFRNYEHKIIAGQEIASIEDYQKGEIVTINGELIKKMNITKSNVLGFCLQSNDKIYLRPSGTEPKIKFYIMIQESLGSLDEKRAAAHKKTENILEFLKTTSEKI